MSKKLSIKDIVNNITDWLFPPRCIYCGKICKTGHLSCEECVLPRVTGNLCPVCGYPSDSCNCNGRKYNFGRCIAPFYYKDKIRDAIIKLKFHENKRVAIELAKEMSNIIKCEYDIDMFDGVVCVPMNKKKLKERKYNQSELLAKNICKNLNLTYLPDILIRNKNSLTQHKLPAQDRWNNVRNSYEIGEIKMKNKSLLLIDDICTTGATLDQCAYLLKKLGASSVFCCVAAINHYKI